MKVQRVSTGCNQYNYLLLDDNFQIIEPVHEYFRFLSGKVSPNSLKVYCFHLKYFFEFLKGINIAYNEVNSGDNRVIDILTDFKVYLRNKPIDEDASAGEQKEVVRSWATINLYITTVLGFYDFLAYEEKIDHVEVYKYHRSIPHYRRLLSELTNNPESKRTNILLVKTAKPIPKYITRVQCEKLKNECAFIRDKLILAFMFEGGLRLGEVIGLHRTDIAIWDNKLRITPRENLENGARVKWQSEGDVYLPPYVMKLYLTYLEKERKNCASEFVFVNLHGKNIGSPMKHSTVQKKFIQIGRKTGIPVHPHMLRHGFATECYRDGLDWRKLQLAMRHRHISTTMDTYVHLESDVLQEGVQAHFRQRGLLNENA
jgi:integrase/recombinase XerD